MSLQYNKYKYKCTTEDETILESVPVDNPAPSVCKNNAGHTVDWTTLRIYQKGIKKSEVGLDNVANIKDNMAAIISPTVTNDNTEGYAILSKWANIVTSEVWICKDASTGAAIWKRIADHQVFSGYSTSTASIGTTWVDIPINIEDAKDTMFTHTANSAEITIAKAGRYHVIARCSTLISSGNSRSQSQMRLVYDVGSGYVEWPGSYGFMYNREVTEGQNTAMVSKIRDFNAGDKIKIQSVRISGNNVVLINGGCGITITSI